MDAGSFALLALVAPGSVEADVGRLQAGIFEAHGLLSAMALPPLVPIAFLALAALERPRALLAGLERSVSSPWRIRVTGPTWVSGWLFLGIDTAGMWAGLRAGALALGDGIEPAAPLPAAEGFFLGCGEASARQREGIMPALPGLSFSSCDIALLRLRMAGSGAWWKDVEWETVDEQPLRGRRQR